MGVLVDVSSGRRSDSHLLSHYDARETFLHMLLAGGDGTYIVACNDKIYKLSESVADCADLLNLA